MKIPKIDSAVIRNPNSRSEVLTRWIVDMAVADGEGSEVDMKASTRPVSCSQGEVDYAFHYWLSMIRLYQIRLDNSLLLPYQVINPLNTVQTSSPSTVWTRTIQEHQVTRMLKLVTRLTTVVFSLHLPHILHQTHVVAVQHLHVRP